MAKRDKNDKIVLGSGEIYATEFDGETVPSHTDVCKNDNLLGYIKSGAALEYNQETYEEKDDLGYASKIITTSEEVLLKCGLITWNGKTLQKLIDRCGVTEANGLRTTKIGGAGNAQGKNYVVCFKHTDKTDGNIWIKIVGRNTAGLIIAFATEEGSLIEPEFKALPHDTNGTLVEFIEEITNAA